MNRFYEIDGSLLPSVTTVLGIIRRQQLEYWRGMVGNAEADRIMYEAAALGKEVHSRCHDVVRGIIQEEEARQNLLVGAFYDWFHATVKEVIESEKPTWSLKYGYAGTPDLVCILKGDQSNPTVVDIKTTGAIWKDMALQTGAYQGALMENGIKPWRRMVVHLNKTNPLRPATIKEYYNHENDFNHFLYTLSLWNYFSQETLLDYEVIRVDKQNG
jgi:hypothetical protein